MRHFPTLLLLALGLAVGVGLLTAAPSEAASGNEGFLYGEVETRSGNTYKGRLRWGDEEAFWGDFFNSSKDERPWVEDAPRDFRRRREAIEIFGVEIGSRWDDYRGGRQFIAPFGAVEELRIRGRNDLTARMKGGFEIDLDGGSNDIGAKIHVWDDSLGEIALQWREIERVRFLSTPSNLDVGGVTRLYGTLYTDDGRTFEGWIQWDQDECLSTDELDGETRDGDLEIEMGRIRSIERRSRWGSNVVLQDGRELLLEGTNDVDDDNRGIFVEDETWGRVLVRWDAFDRLDFQTPKTAGPSYDDYPEGEPLRGTVETRRGDKLSGRIVYDLDESESWEFLNGDYRDVEYNIPFYKIERIEPRGSNASLVTLASGEKIELDDSADVDDGNGGIAVITSGDTEYVHWSDVRSIEFE